MKELEIIKTIDPRIIFEAGAADGTHTVMLSQMFPNATIYAFEPVKYWYNLAVDRINSQQCNNVKLYNLALGETEGIQDIYISYIGDRPWCSNSLLKPKEHLISNPHVLFPTTEECEVVNLDKFCEKNNITKIDFAWFDMQGIEFKIIKSSPIIFKTMKAIYTETNIIETYEGTELYTEYKKFMYDNNYVAISEWFSPTGDQGDTMFVNKNYKHM